MFLRIKYQLETEKGISWEFQQCLSNDTERNHMGRIIETAISGYFMKFFAFYRNWNNWGRISMLKCLLKHEFYISTCSISEHIYIDMWRVILFLSLLSNNIWVKHNMDIDYSNVVVIKRQRIKLKLYNSQLLFWHRWTIFQTRLVRLNFRFRFRRNVKFN